MGFEHMEITPSLCYLYPPYSKKSISQFCVRNRSKLIRMSYKLKYLKNPAMTITVSQPVGQLNPGTKAILM